MAIGTDANGDGIFNDRPSYASASGPGVYSTSFGLLTTNTVNGDVPRNLGTMPDVLHLDANLSRIFTLNPRDKDHPRTLSINARSSNLVNHTNVTAVNTILSSRRWAHRSPRDCPASGIWVYGLLSTISLRLSKLIQLEGRERGFECTWNHGSSIQSA